ncbi:MAG: serine--tRNA ligase, partial [Nitrospira sp.]
MPDLRTLRDNLDTIKSQLGSRGADIPWDLVRALLDQRRTLTTSGDQLRHDLKKGSDAVARLKREKQPADEAMTAMKQLGERITQTEEALRDVEARLTDVALRIP